MIVKFCLSLVLIFSCCYIYTETDNPKSSDKEISYHQVDPSGEIILKVKKAEWLYDCIDCHNDFKTRLNYREMVSEHRAMMYNHIKGKKWCFACHYENLDKRNRIKLGGSNEIYRGKHDMIKLCTACHGEKTKEWEMGIHGKVTGSWKTYGEVNREKKSCDHCHSPHHPRSFKVKPLPGPRLRLARSGKRK